MQLDRKLLGKRANELGFVRDTFEKVYRLREILSFFSQDELLSNTLALKGGTAINLTIFNLPRLSVDIDLDYSKKVNRDEMLNDRKIIINKIKLYMASNGYDLSVKTKTYHALDSLVFEYINCGGNKDNIKIEINYMLRNHILPLEKRIVESLFNNDNIINVLTVSPIEIFASKIVALLTRGAARDLYDIYNMIELGLIKDDLILHKCFVFYVAIGTNNPTINFNFDNILNITDSKIKRDLNPMLPKKEKYNLSLAKDKVIEYLTNFLVLSKEEKEFLTNFVNFA